jgi:hypothetical protein
VTKEVMIDIETFSTSQHNAVVVSVGVVVFKMTLGGPFIHARGMAHMDLTEQLLAQREVLPSTIQFWREQPSVARNKLLGPPSMTALQLRQWLWRLWGDEELDENTPVWAHGIVFDIGNLQTLCECPWTYNAPRDSRTMTRVLQPTRSVPPERLKNLIAHDPVDDCIRQIWGLWSVLPTYKLEGKTNEATAAPELKADPLGR